MAAVSSRRRVLAATLGMAFAPSLGRSAPAEGREAEWRLLARIAEPVLEPLSRGQLAAAMPVEVSPAWDGRDRRVAYLEAFGRTLLGAAPWLALPDDATEEGRARRRLRALALEGLVRAVDPAGPDYMFATREGQALVDAAFVSAALLRAAPALWNPLPQSVKARWVAELQKLRRIDPPYSNWLLFAAANEALLLQAGEAHDPLRISTALRKMDEWYAGDGWIGDGPRLHMDYYNSFVMHPLLLDVLGALPGPDRRASEGLRRTQAQALRRAQRYCETLERFVSPEGTFPPIGRSIVYRTAAFQPLAQLAWRKQLPPSLPEGQVRAVLAAVHRRVFQSPGNFTDKGYLTLGLTGGQPELAERYIDTGSLYITTASFLALGLPAGDSFWTSPAQEWTSRRAFSGRSVAPDRALED